MLKREVTLSIITVCYNAGENIVNTIQSVTSMMTEGMEYIVVDGASSDNTIQVIKEFENIISKFISEPDNGIYDAMNKGLRLAKGRFAYFINAGDMLLNLPDLALFKFSNADLISFPVELSNGKRFFPKIGAALKITNTLHHQGNFYRINKNCFYDLNFKIFADFCLNQQIYKNRGEIIVKDAPIVAFHNLDGISHNKKYLYEIFRVVKFNYGLYYKILSQLYFKKIGFYNKLKNLNHKIFRYEE